MAIRTAPQTVLRTALRMSHLVARLWRVLIVQGILTGVMLVSCVSTSFGAAPVSADNSSNTSSNTSSNSSSNTSSGNSAANASNKSTDKTVPMVSRTHPIAIVIHGGAGTINRDVLMPEMEAAFREKLAEAVTAGHTILKAGGTSREAVLAAIVLMEDSPLFNAGHGAVLNHKDG